jgi:cell division protein FtsN
MWLGPHVTTNDGREFLVAIQPLEGDAKALALETEAKRVGLTTCALATEWRGHG